MSSSDNKFAFMDKELQRRQQNSQLRSLCQVTPLNQVEVEINGKIMVNFSSNDYLALSRHPELKKRAAEFMKKYGAGSTASRLICGTTSCYGPVEKKLAALKGTEAALILNSGFQANITVLPALTDKKSLILSDELNHNSLIQGAILSRCEKKIFHHNDTFHLEELLKEAEKKDYSRILIVTESVFSMDGDCANLSALAWLSREYGAMLMVDEAHATGVLGKNGMGLCAGEDIDIIMGTFGKAAGSFGAYVAISEKMRDYFINKCTGFVFSTALPPQVIGAIDAALDLMPLMDRERIFLHENADYIRKKFHEMGLDTAGSNTQIIPVITGSEEKTLNLARYLMERGILATPIRPPTVEKGKSRIRLTISSGHTKEHINNLVKAFDLFFRGGK